MRFDLPGTARLAWAPDKSLRQRSLSTGAFGPGFLNNRYYSTLNYGTVAVLPGEVIEITIRNVDSMKLLRAEVHRDPRDWPIWLAYMGSLLFLVLAVRYREKIFLSNVTRCIPYLFVMLLGILLLTWNL